MTWLLGLLASGGHFLDLSEPRRKEGPAQILMLHVKRDEFRVPVVIRFSLREQAGIQAASLHLQESDTAEG